MKKVFALILALTLIISLGATFATAASDGSITITNATIGDTYRVYKIFDAAYDEEGVTYTISPKLLDANGNEVDNKIFVYLFGANGDQVNACFSYNPENGRVTSKTDGDTIFTELTTMIRAGHHNGYVEQAAASSLLTFDNLDYGYYLIDKDSTGEVAVTIDSNTPHVDVIDKNQTPGTEFDKVIVKEDGTTTTDYSANIGEIINYKINFTATNYYGEFPIEYYTIDDTKGGAIWVEFNDITVTVDGIPLTKGYYHYAGDPNDFTDEWEYLGTGWGDFDKNNESTYPDPDGAEWYLIHRGFDDFDIVIPWMENHNFTGTATDFTLTYPDNADSKYGSPVEVIIEYSASVEPNADIGSSTSNNLWNKAELSWTYDGETGRPTDDPPTTNTTVYALGITKVDANATTKHLAGAVFRIYRDSAHDDPVFVIPTDVEGVYILDDLKTDVSGEHRETSREKYASKLEAYLGPDYANKQDNKVTTPVNGKIVILGLAAGTYYLDEIDAPDGYNELVGDVEVTVGTSNIPFVVISKDDGTAVDATNAGNGEVRHEYSVTHVPVKNSKGMELPSTGGEGTMLMITIGTMVALAFAVLLITHKKMTAYRD